MRKLLYAGLLIGLPLMATAQTNRHNNLGSEEHLWKMKKIAPHEFIAVGNGASVVRYNDSCNDWLPLTVAAGSEFRNISFPTPNTGYISGTANSLFKTTNAGNSWTAIPATATGLTNGSIQCIHFLDAQNGFIAGSQIGVSGGGRFIKKTSDGGTTWTTVTPAGIATSTVYDMAFFPSGTGIAVATNNQAFRSTDNGNTWTAIATPGTVYSVAVAGSTVVVAVANSLIMRSADQGQTWTTIPTTAGGLQGVHFYDAQHGMITGANGTILYTTDAGLSWSTIPTLLSQKLYDVQMTSATTAVAVGANGVAIDIDVNQHFHRFFEEHFCHPQDSITYTRYNNADRSGATSPRKWFFNNVNEDQNGLEAAQWFPGKFAIYDAYYYEDVLMQHHSDSAYIETRILNLSGASQLSLEWNEAFYTHVDGRSKTIVEGFNGSTWIKLSESTGLDFGDGVSSAVFPSFKRTIDISPLAGLSNARLRFGYIAPNTNDGLKNFWAVSDIVISNRSTAVQLDSIFADNTPNTDCLDISPKAIKVRMRNTGDLPVFPLELAWSSSNGQSGVTADYNALNAGSFTDIELISNFAPPSAGGAITIKAWIKKLPNQNPANDTISKTFYFVPSTGNTALLGNDRSICPGTTLVLQAPASLANSTWSDGSTGNSLSINNAGTYWISGTYGTCAVSDTVTISLFTVSTPVISQQGTTLSVATGYSTYEWFKDNVAIANSNNPSLSVTQSGNYTVQVTTTDGCTALSSAYAYSQTTGIEGVDKNRPQLVLAPNPATDVVRISSNTILPKDAVLSLYDMSGKRLLEQPFKGDHLQLDISKLASGIYLLRLQASGYTAQHKLIKK
ncbi:hypothetical protein DBR32_14660 [Taibaiella sp. KBW10]|uniref:T9SS type A sorting domain-containing protein n=1 Tax=Taibaiella sp. KBW10 TaxID=2153357 RepID=UPI000F5B06E6|nr:T9SS type A sorting domain-containing protein [Taibaiella sp. KBW10]RQO29822.1 hypothetical protein DBR32_14660 [Taibaiella sp. KBW10]